MITFERFINKYHPTKNLFSDDLEEIRFETYGKEQEYVLKQGDEYVWTAIHCPNENVYTIPGKHFVNRSHYYVCRHPWNDNTIEVNENEMIYKERAVQGCLDFFRMFNYTLDKKDVVKYFKEIHHEKTQITIGDAKYFAIDYWESLDNELTQEQDDAIHNFYSNLI